MSAPNCRRYQSGIMYSVMFINYGHPAWWKYGNKWYEIYDIIIIMMIWKDKITAYIEEFPFLLDEKNHIC